MWSYSDRQDRVEAIVEAGILGETCDMEGSRLRETDDLAVVGEMVVKEDRARGETPARSVYGSVERTQYH